MATKGEKCLVTTYIEDGVEHKRSRLRPFVSIIVLCLLCLLCFTFCYLSWATLYDVVFSDYYESILFYVGSRVFEISTKLAVTVASCSVVAQWCGQMICNSATITVCRNNNDDGKDCLITIMILAPCWAWCLCFVVL